MKKITRTEFSTTSPPPTSAYGAQSRAVVAFLIYTDLVIFIVKKITGR